MSVCIKGQNLFHQERGEREEREKTNSLLQFRLIRLVAVLNVPERVLLGTQRRAKARTSQETSGCANVVRSFSPSSQCLCDNSPWIKGKRAKRIKQGRPIARFNSLGFQLAQKHETNKSCTSASSSSSSSSVQQRRRRRRRRDDEEEEGGGKRRRKLA